MHIRIYFVNQSNILREKWSITTPTTFLEGELSLKKYQVQINSGVLYALVGPPGGWSLRVGYQAARAPNAITEASHIEGVWDERAFA
ncbi:hypothetical protein CVT26_002538 [Gymnopilus dilepis]|uniref:Uncharacterized protein n=1 Tax=Gymnopilus dilepis TaxID=231916 RepID=A0A409Y3W8_9AGAR|nr:hypothetical protein CVT26_002538 [Gymnopilus dilepis]